jgi:hypothetical protein
VNVGRGGRRATGIELVPLDPAAQLAVDIDHLDHATQERITALVPFVAGLRTLFARQWPAAGVDQARPGHATRTYPFPDCWPLHPVLVVEFGLVRTTTNVIESGEIELSAIGGETDRWMRHVREVTVLMVREIAQLCMVSGTARHIDVTVPRPGFGPAQRAQTRTAVRPAVPWARWPRGPGRGGLGGLS